LAFEHCNKIRLMLDTLKEILSTGTIARVEEYKWRGHVYLRMFMRRRKDCAWDGPKTGSVIKLIEEAQRATLRQQKEAQPKKKGTR
jgi:hypothetical protein